MTALVDAPAVPRVRLVSLLAEGGMSTVWRAQHLELGCPVAVKLLDPGRAMRPTAAARFRREARLAASLTSPHAVRVFDHGVLEDGAPYMVMECLEGETLAARLAREGPLALASWRELVHQLVGVLEEAHRKGIVHRDVKPSNVFLVESEYALFAKLLDFGVARWLHECAPGELTAEGVCVGTPHYMSPEQLLEPRNVDARTDWWSLGVLAYEAVTGARPFESGSAAGLTAAICRGEYPPATGRRAALPPALDAWFARALSATVDDRFEGGRSLRDALDLALAGDSGGPSIRRSTEPRSDEAAEKVEPNAEGGDGAPRRASPSTDDDAVPRGLMLDTTESGVDALAGDEASSTAVTPAEPRRRDTRPRLALFMGIVVAASLALASERLRVGRATPGGDSFEPSTKIAFREGVGHDSPKLAPSALESSPRPVTVATSEAQGAGSGFRPSSGVGERTASPGRGASIVPAAKVGAGDGAPTVRATPTRVPEPPPAYCASDSGFIVDARGHLEPRPECLR